MSANGMRQIGERHIASCIEIMVWCNRMDLLALSNTKGEVQLHRLNWQRVWSLPPPSDTSLVKAMAWRPDGKVLAVGYSCGITYLVAVEDKEILDTIKPESDKEEDKSKCGSVTCVSWRSRPEEQNSSSVYKNYDAVDVFLLNHSSSSNYKKNEDNGPEFRQSQTHFNILSVGYENSELHMFVFGFFPCGVIDLKKVLKMSTETVKIVDAQFCHDFTSIRIFLKDSKDNNLKLVIIDTESLAAFSDELYSLATKHCHMNTLLMNTDQTMTSIIEAWEQILLEMDSKLEKYASQVPEGGISADFLDLLMLGVPSTELEIFLLQDLTAKGLKKFGASVELSYSTIQKLVLKQLHTVGHDITYHLAELRGLSRITHRYKILGLEEDVVTDAILSSSAFINKCLELQQVIDHAMKNYKAFFRWLYIVIVRLMDEHAPAEIVKITQQDLTYIAEFLLNFDKVGTNNVSKENAGSSSSEKKGRFNLERLGQYLVNKELTIAPDDENPWHIFLNNNQCLANNPSIVKSFKKFSLVQQQNHLKEAVYKVFNCSEKSLASQFSLIYIINCTPCVLEESLITGSLKMSQINAYEENTLLSAFTDLGSPEKGFYYLEASFKNNVLVAKSCYFYFHAPKNMNDSKLEILEEVNLKVIDVQFYSCDALSVLLEQPNDDISVFAQFPVKLARIHSVEVNVVENMLNIDSLSEIPKLNAFKFLEAGTCKILDKISGWRIAVSGGRKVAVVLSKTCRKVRLFEMEVDGEDDDDETSDTTPQSHSTTQLSDNSQHVSMNESGIANVSTRNIDENVKAESIDSDTSENF